MGRRVRSTNRTLKYIEPNIRTMFRAILPDGDITCETYDRQDTGVELYTEDGTLIAFVPYPNLVALVNDAVRATDERSIM